MREKGPVHYSQTNEHHESYFQGCPPYSQPGKFGHIVGSIVATTPKGSVENPSAQGAGSTRRGTYLFMYIVAHHLIEISNEEIPHWRPRKLVASGVVGLDEAEEYRGSNCGYGG